MITMDNAEEYVDLMFDFCMHTGIQKQMEAFRGNFFILFSLIHPPLRQLKVKQYYGQELW